MKIVLNEGYGGFCLSVEATRMILERKNIPFYEVKSQFGIRFHETKTGKRIYLPVDIDRHDPDLIAVVELLEKDANASGSDLYIEDIPAGTKYIIREHRGREWLEI